MPHSRQHTFCVEAISILFVFLLLMHGDNSKRLRNMGFKVKNRVNQVSTTNSPLLDSSTFDNKTSSFVFTFPTVANSSVGQTGQYEEQEPFSPSKNVASRRVWDSSEPYS